MPETPLSRELFQERAVLLAVNAELEAKIHPLLGSLQKAAKAMDGHYQERDEAQACEAIREFHMQLGNLHSRISEMRALLMPQRQPKPSSAAAPANSAGRELRPAAPPEIRQAQPSEQRRVAA